MRHLVQRNILALTGSERLVNWLKATRLVRMQVWGLRPKLLGLTTEPLQVSEIPKRFLTGASKVREGKLSPGFGERRGETGRTGGGEPCKMRELRWAASGGRLPPARGHQPVQQPRPSHPPLFVNSALAAAPLPLTRPPLSGQYLHNPASPCYDWLIASSLLRVGGTPEGQGWAAPAK